MGDEEAFDVVMLVEMAEMIAIYRGGTKETLEKCGNEANQIG